MYHVPRIVSKQALCIVIFLAGFSVSGSASGANIKTDEVNLTHEIWNGWGEYIWGEGENVVRPCGQNLVYWVDADKHIQEKLVAAYMRFMNRPYKPIYIRFKGISWTEKLDGFASNYNKLMRIEQIFIAQDGVPAECEQ